MVNICDILAVDHSGLRPGGISGMSHKVSVWRANQLPSVPSCACLHAALYKTVSGIPHTHTDIPGKKKNNNKQLSGIKVTVLVIQGLQVLGFKGQTPRLLFDHGWAAACNVLNGPLNPPGIISAQPPQSIPIILMLLYCTASLLGMSQTQDKTPDTWAVLISFFELNVS